MSVNIKDIRASSCEVAKQFGIEISGNLPCLDRELKSRQESDVVVRALVVSVIVATSYGLKRETALSWLKQESLIAYLSPLEKSFLNGSDENRQEFQVQVEVLCAFAWTLGLLSELDFSKGCPNHLVSIFPDFKKLESAERFRKQAALRQSLEIIQACDTAYCLHWGVKQAMIDGIDIKINLSQIIVVERRRALEWILSNEDWDNITLDT